MHCAINAKYIIWFVQYLNIPAQLFPQLPFPKSDEYNEYLHDCLIDFTVNEANIL